MRLYAVDASGNFVEYQTQSFAAEHKEKTMEDWLEGNPNFILENSPLLLIGRQVSTDLGGYIDLLGIDRSGDVAVIELKRDRTPRETLAQALEYAVFAEQLDYDQLEQLYQDYSREENTPLIEAHQQFFALGSDEAVSFNKDQRIIIVGANIADPVRETAIYLGKRGLRVTCLEFGYFTTHGGEELLSIDVAVGEKVSERKTPSTSSLPKTTSAKFLGECDEMGIPIFQALLDMADEQNFPIHWGSRGFSLNVDVAGNHISIGMGYPKATKRQEANQSLRVTFGEIAKKLPETDALVTEFQSRFSSTGLFVPSGSKQDLRFWINQPILQEQQIKIVELFAELGQAVKHLAEQAFAFDK